MTKVVRVGDVLIGGGNKIAVQSMTNTVTKNADATSEQINALTDAGCDIVRVAVADAADAEALGDIKKRIKVPLVADIHFDYRLAVAAVRNGADKIRINPGNIGSGDGLKKIISAAKERGVAIRIGVNGGSLGKDILARFGNTAAALAESALEYVRRFEDMGFDNIVLSVKSSDVRKTVDACRILAKECDYPQHIGVTESGSGESARVKSAIGIGALLLDGIGDTIRVSLTDNPVKEVLFAKEILRAVGKDKNYCEVISCPSCGRCGINLIAVAQEIKEYVKDIKKPMKIAVMGCAVNGPGEAADADLGLAGGQGKAVFFKNGKVFRTVAADGMTEEFKREIDKIR